MPGWSKLKSQLFFLECGKSIFELCEKNCFNKSPKSICLWKLRSAFCQQVHVSASLPVAYGLSWHGQLPVLAVGGDCAVHLWVVEST